MPETSLRVLIVGGGIGGITAALALRQCGIDAIILEQARAFTQVGAGIQLSANATRVLRRLGLGEPLARVSAYPEARDYRAWDTAERLYLTPLGERAEARFGAPYYHAHRADLLDVLLGGLGETGFRPGARVEGVDEAGNGVSARLADSTSVAGDVLVGPVPVAVAGVRAGLAALAPGGAAHGVGVCGHQGVDERGQHLAQQVRTCLGQLLVQELGRVDNRGRGHRVIHLL